MPTDMNTLGDLIAENAALNRDRLAFSCRDRRLSHGRFYERCSRVADALFQLSRGGEGSAGGCAFSPWGSICGGRRHRDPRSKMGEAVRALVVRRARAEPTAQALIDHCRERIASYKKPRACCLWMRCPSWRTEKWTSARCVRLGACRKRWSELDIVVHRLEGATAAVLQPQIASGVPSLGRAEGLRTV